MTSSQKQCGSSTAETTLTQLTTDRQRTDGLSRQVLSELASIIASEGGALPSNLSETDTKEVLRETGRLRRQRLVEFIANAIGAHIFREK